MPEQSARCEIERAFPELGVHEIAFLGAGIDSEAYLVDGAWVFRFPKREDVSRALGREIALLPKLAERLPVVVPRFSYVGRQARNGLLFAGYPLIPGEPLTRVGFDAFPGADQQRALTTLAEILRGVHGFPVEEALAAGVQTLSTHEWVASIWADAAPTALPLLSPDDALALAGLIDGFLADDADTGEPCLLYADFAPEHLLHDPSTRTLTGLIDWGDLTIGDPDYDLMYLYQDYGEELVRRLIPMHLGAASRGLDPDRLIRKLRAFNACDHLRDLASAAPGDDLQESLAALHELVTRA